MTTGLTSTGFVAATTSDVQTSIQNDELALIDPALNLSPVQPLGQLNGIFASAAANLWALVQAIYAAIDPSSAVGVQLDNLCAITGCIRQPATKTLVLCNATLSAGTYAAGTLTANISGYPQYTFVNRDQIISAGGLVSNVYWVATTTGPIAANANTLTVITNPVAGWSTITNPNAGTIGTNVETDTALRLRRASLLTASGGASIDSIRSSLLNPTLVPGIIQAVVLENNLGTVDPNGQPGNSFQAVIWDGLGLAADPNKIAQAIWNSKPAGIQAFGTSYGQALDVTGTTRIVNFTRVTAVPIYFSLTVRTNPLLFPTNGVALIKAAMQAQGLLQTPGTNASIYTPSWMSSGAVFVVAYEAAVMSVPGVVDITAFTLGTAPAPVGTSNISIGATQIATVGTNDIVVTVL